MGEIKKQMIDSAHDIPISWLTKHSDKFDCMAVYIGGPNALHVHTLSYVQKVAQADYRVLPIYVGSQAKRINTSPTPDALARSEAKDALKMLGYYGLLSHPIAWDFEYAPMTSNIRLYLDTVARYLANSTRILYSSQALGYVAVGWSGRWTAHYTMNAYNPFVQPFGGASQYAGNITYDGQLIDLSAYNEKIIFPSEGPMPLNAPIIAIHETPTNNGYYLFGSDGGVFCFGDANFRGSGLDVNLVGIVTSAAITSTNNGYWLVTDKGNVYAFGDAQYHGGIRLG